MSLCEMFYWRLLAEQQRYSCSVYLSLTTDRKVWNPAGNYCVLLLHVFVRPSAGLVRLSHVRIPGVLQRLGLTYFVVASSAAILSPKSVTTDHPHVQKPLLLRPTKYHYEIDPFTIPVHVLVLSCSCRRSVALSSIWCSFGANGSCAWRVLVLYLCLTFCPESSRMSKVT